MYKTASVYNVFCRFNVETQSTVRKATRAENKKASEQSIHKFSMFPCFSFNLK